MATSYIPASQVVEMATERLREIKRIQRVAYNDYVSKWVHRKNWFRRMWFARLLGFKLYCFRQVKLIVCDHKKYKEIGDWYKTERDELIQLRGLARLAVPHHGMVKIDPRQASLLQDAIVTAPDDK